MSLFPRFSNSEFGPLFRLMEEYGNQDFSSSVRAFAPKFDVREHKESYELQGELPGIEQKDIHIEFADPHTLVVKGRIEREYSSDGANKAQGRITGEVTKDQSHKATVEDDPAETENKNTDVSTSNGKGNNTVGKHDKHHQHQQNGPKYWVSERSVGEFHRAFSFPSRVDQDAVKANLKNGILNITVPKATSHQSKRIAVE